MNVVLDTWQKVTVFNFKYAWLVSKTDMLMKLAKVVKSKGLEWLKKTLSLSCDTYNWKYKVEDSVLGGDLSKHFKDKATNYLYQNNEMCLYSYRHVKPRWDSVGDYILDKKINTETLEESLVFSFDIFNKQF